MGDEEAEGEGDAGGEDFDVRETLIEGEDAEIETGFKGQGRKSQTRNQLARNQLEKDLIKFSSDINDNERYQISDIFESMKQLPYMNMEILAAAIVLQRRMGNDVKSPLKFQEEVEPLLTQMGLRETNKEGRYRTKVELYKYLTAIISFLNL